MFIALLVILLSKPDEPMVFGVVQQFKTYGECVKAMQDMDVPDESRKNLGCIEVKSHREI